MWLSAAVEIKCKWLVDDDGQVSGIINPPLIINNRHNPRIIQSNPIQSLSYRVRQTLVMRRCFFGSHQIDCVINSRVRVFGLVGTSRYRKWPDLTHDQHRQLLDEAFVLLLPMYAILFLLYS